MPSVSPCRAFVRPRVVSPITGDAVLLEDEIADLLQTQKRCFVALWGPRCSGKTTALQHLAAVLPDDRLLLLDDNQVPSRDWTVRHRVLVHVPQGDYSPDVVLNMAPWSDDDVLEYLLAVSPARTASVMSRWQIATDHDLAEGSPEVVRLVLDRMIANEEAHSVRAVLQETFRQFHDQGHLARRIGIFALATRLGVDQAAFNMSVELKRDLPEAFLRILNLEGVRTVLAAAHVLESLPSHEEVLHAALPEELLQECGQQFAQKLEVEHCLQRILSREFDQGQAMAASILHAAGRPVRFDMGVKPFLSNAVLGGISWSGMTLAHALMQRTDLSYADLSDSNLDHATLPSANLVGAALQRATLRNADGAAADLTGADLSHSVAENSKWEDAKFVGARLQCAQLKQAVLNGADFGGADLSEADLSGAYLTNAKLEGADLRSANLSFAYLAGARLRDAQLDGAVFLQANLVGCDFEGVRLVSPNFKYAKLQKALLTGSVMDAPNFQHADLRETGLADIQWLDADLRNADLRGASFHLGSTRCGLVDSPYPSHGTRTGFYTNEYDEQNFRAPEDIRKADLRGADLRGANIAKVDFYLVDLRGARYDPEQLQHLIQCDAILHDRTIN